MRKTLLLSTALAFALASAPALADETTAPKANGFYAALGMGMSSTNDAEIDFKTLGAKESVELDNDYAVAGAVGYRFSPWVRVEGEIGHFSGDLGDDTGLSSASVSIMTYMVNAFVDWKNQSRFTPYLGFGLGVASISSDASETFVVDGTSYTWASDDKGSAFAWQIGAGSSVQITDNIAMDLGWRYLDTTDVTLDSSLDGTSYPFETSLSSHIFRAGVRYEF